MAGQYFPQGDDELKTWMANFLLKLLDVMAALGLPATFDDALVAKVLAYNTSLDEQESAGTVAEQKTGVKKTTRGEMITLLRSVVKDLAGKPGFSDAMRVLLGLPAIDVIPTPIEPGTEIPTVELEQLGPQKHRVHFWDPGVAQGRRGKPPWARAGRIMYAVVASGAAPPPLSQMLFLAIDSAAPYDWDIPAEHIGKMIYYRVAWETPTHELGPWSAALGAIVGG